MKINSKVFVVVAMMFAAACVTHGDGDDQMDEEEGECGDNVCTGDESPNSCPQDCDDAPAPTSPTLRVKNDSSYTVYRLYVYRCSDTAFGTDQLGTRTISPGITFTLTNVPAGCWKFRAEGSGSLFWQSPSSGVTLTTGQTFTWTLQNASG